MNKKISALKNIMISKKALAVIVCVSLAVGSVAVGAFAKYKTEVAISDNSGAVAKWEVAVNGKDVTGGTESKTFDLFKTIKDTDGKTDEANVALNRIAPGTSGSFEVKIENKSEVNATYNLTFAIKNDSNIPVQFSTDGGKNWQDSISDLNLTDESLAMINGTVTHTIQWRWAFSGTNSDAVDAADTALGIAAQTSAPSITVTCTATFTQVD